ncbi:MAG: hypothetical protein R3B70_43360 [Polyangiaceae bacterium]
MQSPFGSPQPPQGYSPSPFGPSQGHGMAPFGPSPKPPVNKRKILAIPAVVLLFGALIYGCFVGVDVEAAPGDRDLVITVEDVTVGLDFHKNAAHETLKRTWYLDGSFDILYEYDDTDGTAPLYVSSQVTRASSRADAGGQLTGMKLGAKATFSMMSEGVAETPRDHLFRWGDESSLVFLTVPEGDVGYYFVGRKDKAVVMVIVGGMGLPEGVPIERVIGSKLEVVSTRKF